MIGRLWDFIVHAFKNPDDYRNDPRGHAVNQVLHFGAVGAGLCWLSGSFALVVAFVLIWEGLQLKLRGAKFWDCVEDAFFMLSGALWVVLLQDVWPAWPVFVVVVPVFLAGLIKRTG